MKTLPASIFNISTKFNPQTVKWVLLLVSLGLMVIGAGAPFGGGGGSVGGG